MHCPGCGLEGSKSFVDDHVRRVHKTPLDELAADRRDERIEDVTSQIVLGDHYEAQVGDLNVVREKPIEEGGYL